MRKRLMITIAGATLIGSGGLAAAQHMDSSPRGASGAQGSSQREPGGGVHERQPGAMQRPAQGRSTATGEEGHRAGHPGAMQGPAHGRSTAAGEERQRSGHSGVTQGPVRDQSNTEQSRGQVTEQRSVSTTLSQDQTTRLHETMSSGDFRRVDHVDFSLAVGTRVPDTATFYDVPETIVDILPQYRGFEYIVVGDELVIVDPDTLEIVAVLPA